jgi:hypothetical protein
MIEFVDRAIGSRNFRLRENALSLDEELKAATMSSGKTSHLTCDPMSGE